MNEIQYNDIDILKIKVNDIQKNVNMITNRITEIVKSEVKIQLAEQQLQILISNIIKEEIKDNFNTYLTNVIESMSKTIINKFRKEMEIAKTLAYSIDKTIQHSLMKSSCGVEEHKIFMKRAYEIFKIMENKILEIPEKELLKINND